MYASIRIIMSLHALSVWITLLVSGAPYPDSPAETSKRSLNSWVSIGNRGNWPCSATQIRAIERAVEYTKILANAAVIALDGVGTSGAAYSRWFGDSTQSSDSDMIMQHHYAAVSHWLRDPESGTVDSVEEGGVNPQRLVYACPAADSGLCASGEAAAVVNAGDGLKVNLLYLCPSFFSKVSNGKMLSDWRRDTYTPSSGLVLLHEMQHLDAVVGADRRTGDIAYTKTDCMNLKPEDKVKNAQNFAFFALDVMANPPV